MADKARYEPNKSAASEIMSSPEALRIVSELAIQAEEFARSIAPVKSGEYKRSFKTTAAVIGDRAMALLINDSPHAVVVEVFNNGTGDRIMAKAAESVKGK